MATSQTPKIAKGITQDMLVSVYKPIGTGENSEVFAGTIADLKEALGIEPAGSGITSITSTDGSISIDNTDPNEPDLSALKLVSEDGFSEIQVADNRRINANLDGEKIMILWKQGGDFKIGFFDKSATDTPSPQAAAIPDATDLASAIAAVNDLLAAMRAYGLIAE